MNFVPSNVTARAPARPTFKPHLEQLEDRCVPAKLLTPVIFVPGQPASLPADFVAAVNAGDEVAAGLALSDFLTHLGAQPEDLTSIFELEPIPGLSEFDIVSPTNALVDALEDSGYILGVNLFVAAHDWRMPIAPLEQGANRADDGILRIGKTLDGSDDQFDTGLDYLAYWMDVAGEAWQTATGKALRQLDIISHSEGYLLTRAYISSTLYHGTYIDDDGVASTLPKVRNWISLGGPNGGASGIYNLLLNNGNNAIGISDDGGGLYPLIELAYLAVTGGGEDILRPDGTVLFAGGSTPDPLDFIQQYVPSMRAEMPTYAFIQNGGTLSDINDNPLFRNDFLLDVNYNGPGRNYFGNPSGFVKRLQKMSVFYGAALPTLSLVRQGVGTGQVLPLSTNPLDFGQLQPTSPGQVWYEDISTPKNGDSLIGLQSSEQLFKQYRHHNLKLYPQKRMEIDHDALVTDAKIHKQILKILGVRAGHRCR